MKLNELNVVKKKKGLIGNFWVPWCARRVLFCDSAEERGHDILYMMLRYLSIHLFLLNQINNLNDI